MDSRSTTFDNTAGIITTVVIHVIIALLLLFLAMPELKLDPPLPPPLELDLEFAGGMTSGGNNNPVQDKAAPNTPNTAPTPTKTTSSAENTMTATQGADSKASGSSPTPNTSNNTSATSQPSINSNALMGKASSSGTSGSGAGSLGQGGGDGPGPGGPDNMGYRGANGINLHGLTGRGFKEKPGPIEKDAIREEGTVVVQIRVNNAGIVTEALTEGFKIPDGIPKTTITDPQQKLIARKEALKYKFTEANKGFDDTGYIVYTFKFRN
ncbi:MAG TPA: hypothetical protein VIL57_08575 [Bacteroidia bacterium]